MIHIEHFYFNSFPYFYACNPVNDQQQDGQPITTVEILSLEYVTVRRFKRSFSSPMAGGTHGRRSRERPSSE
jgi:hypothetical protein